MCIPPPIKMQAYLLDAGNRRVDGQRSCEFLPGLRAHIIGAKATHKTTKRETVVSNRGARKAIDPPRIQIGIPSDSLK